MYRKSDARKRGHRFSFSLALAYFMPFSYASIIFLTI